MMRCAGVAKKRQLSHGSVQKRVVSGLHGSLGFRGAEVLPVVAGSVPFAVGIESGVDGLDEWDETA
jgi:hypothetical protein